MKTIKQLVKPVQSFQQKNQHELKDVALAPSMLT